MDTLRERIMRNNFKYVITVLSLVFSLTAIAFGQETTGSIEGTVKDQTGAVVPNVSVTVANKATGYSRVVTTDGSGFFRVVQIPTGNYAVSTAATSGFSATTYDNVNVTGGNTTAVEVKLAIGTGSVTVDVSGGDAVAIDPTGSKVQTSVTAAQMELIPKNGNFTSVLKVVPGTRGENFAGGFQVDGASGSENSFMIDGQEVNNFRTGAIRSNQNVPTQFVSEVSVRSSGFEAEFGGATGGVINVITKGGSNDWHGDFGIGFDTSKLNGAPTPTLTRFTSGASATFVQTSEYESFPKIDAHTFLPTANLGGPIVKNKVWFYGSYSPQILSQSVNTAFYTNAPRATRTFRFSELYTRETTNEYAFGRIDATPFDSLRLTGTYTWNPVATDGALPFNTISFGGTPPSVNFGGSIGTLTGNQLTERQGGRETANNITGQGVWTPTSKMIFTGRYSRGFANEKAGNYYAVLAPQYNCVAGSTTIANACTTGAVDAVNGGTIKDVSLRTNYQLDATFIANFGGRHEFKGGWGWIQLTNDVANGYSELGRIALWYDGSTIRDRGSIATPTPGAIGSGTLTRIGTNGTGTNTSQQLFFQDKWQPTRNLTLNLGLRAEKEDLPSFNQYAPPIQFGWGEKIVPRLGFAYDIGGAGKSKLFGSYSEFTDRLRFDLPRGSFGGDFFRTDYFEIFPNSGPFRTAFTLNSILGNFGDAAGGSCPTTGFIGSGLSRCQADFRIASNSPDATLEDGKVDPDLKPFKQREITVGYQRQLSQDYRLSTRYVYKNVLDAVEDAGVRNAAGSEAYILGNPGIGLHREQLNAFGYIKGATPERRYDAVEVVLDKRLSNKYFYSLNYTYSRLYGNYSGLASSDELGRTSPGVNRFFDLPHFGYTSTGEPDNGRLATDRPHVFNAFGAYLFDWKGSKTNETSISVFQTFQSGTPISTTVAFYATTIYTKRGDLGRSPTFSQTDLSFTHKYRFGRDNRFALTGNLNLLNAWNQDIVTNYNVSTSAVTLTEASLGFATATAATNAWTAGTLGPSIEAFLNGTPTALNRRNSSYKLPNTYQAPRGVRFGFNFTF